MQIYLVGGAVRDKLLNKPSKDKDFVVVGATPEQMLAQGFLQVGVDFPVFLHPISKQEYALARTERKSGHGYQGFSIYASPDVTLEEDLQRRDLTINAMAIEVTDLYDDTPLTGEVIDYYGGLADIESKTLRHISPAFSEDPLRVLRVARFYSRYFADGFTIADETLALMRELVASGELEHLSAERIWQESYRAMMQLSPQIYWQQLYEIGALQTYFAPLNLAWDNIHSRETVQTALYFAGQMQLNLSQRWALLMASLDRELFVPNDVNEQLRGSANSSTSKARAIDAIVQIGQSAKVPKEHVQFAKLFIERFEQLTNMHYLNAQTQIELIQSCSAHKQPEKLSQLLVSAQVMTLARQHRQMMLALDSYHAISMDDIDTGLKGPAIGEALTAARVQHLQSVIEQMK